MMKLSKRLLQLGLISVLITSTVLPTIVSAATKPATTAQPAASPKPAATATAKMLSASDFKKYSGLTMSKVLTQYGKTLNDESSLSDVRDFQDDYDNAILDYEDIGFYFDNQEIAAVYLRTPKYQGPRGVKVGMSEKAFLKLFYNRNLKVKKMLTTKTELVTLLDVDSEKNNYVTLYDLKQGFGVIAYYVDNQDYEDYRFVYLDDASGYLLTASVIDGKIDRIGMIFMASSN